VLFVLLPLLADTQKQKQRRREGNLYFDELPSPFKMPLGRRFTRFLTPYISSFQDSPIVSLWPKPPVQ
jgi:hypothetical protein